MHDNLFNIIQDIRKRKSILSMDEASTKNAVVLRLISALGWDHFDIQEVKPEYSIGTKRVDYALRISNINKVFIEVKRINENLELHQEQLLAYSFQEGVKLAVLTNGSNWWFYLPLNEGAWEKRRFYTLDLFSQDINEICNKLIDFLSKDNVLSGEAVTNAEHVYKGRFKKNILQEAIPKAWTEIISEPNDILVDLLIETTESISGYRAEKSDIEKFLNDNLAYLQSIPTIRKDDPYVIHASTKSPDIKPPRSSVADLYEEELIEVPDDSPTNHAIEPPKDNKLKPNVARVEYEVLKENPYKFNEKEFHYEVLIVRQNKSIKYQLWNIKRSNLVKKYGWGIHKNKQGKLALVPMESDMYKKLQKSIKCTKGFRSSKK